MTARTTIQGFFDPATGTVSYVVWEHAGRHAAVIDPVFDYDFRSGHTGTASADRLLAYLREHALQLEWILETHAHADHLSGARHVQQHAGGKIAIGENIRLVQATFGKLFNFERAFLAGDRERSCLVSLDGCEIFAGTQQEKLAPAQASRRCGRS